MEEEYDSNIANIKMAAEIREKMTQRRQFQRKKDLDTVSTIISTATAAVGALEAMSSIPYVGPFLGIAMMAAIIAMGGAQVAYIQSQQLPMLYEGGIVPGSSTGMPLIAGDRNQAEAILPLDKLSDMINGGGSRTIQLQVDGRTLAEVVDNERNKKAYRMNASNYSYRSVY